MKIKLYANIRGTKLIAGLHTETPSRVFDYNSVDGLQTFGREKELTEHEGAIARTVKFIYNNNLKGFSAVNNAFDGQIARAEYAKLCEVFNDGVEIN